MNFFTRNRGSRRDGSSWSEHEKLAVWNKGRVILFEDPRLWRKDGCGAIMKYSDHGNTNSSHGWEIDHILPVSKGGDDNLSNLQPLHWKNNRAKGDDIHFSCEVTS